MVGRGRPAEAEAEAAVRLCRSPCRLGLEVILHAAVGGNVQGQEEAMPCWGHTEDPAGAGTQTSGSLVCIESKVFQWPCGRQKWQPVRGWAGRARAAISAGRVLQVIQSPSRPGMPVCLCGGGPSPRGISQVTRSGRGRPHAAGLPGSKGYPSPWLAV